MTANSDVIRQPNTDSAEIPVAAADSAGGPGPTATEAQIEREPSEDEYIELLGKLPPEIGTMLIAVGIAGVLLPGPIGAPMLLAGAVVIWPKTFAPMERTFARCCPAIHREGVHQIKRYLADLHRRFPD